jgi:hypothetical protein
MDVLTRAEFQGGLFRVAASRRFDARRQRLKSPNLDCALETLFDMRMYLSGDWLWGSLREVMLLGWHCVRCLIRLVLGMWQVSNPRA